jgi:hypothetical protein
VPAIPTASRRSATPRSEIPRCGRGREAAGFRSIQHPESGTSTPAASRRLLRFCEKQKNALKSARFVFEQDPISDRPRISSCCRNRIESEIWLRSRPPHGGRLHQEARFRDVAATVRPLGFGRSNIRRAGPQLQPPHGGCYDFVKNKKRADISAFRFRTGSDLGSTSDFLLLQKQDRIRNLAQILRSSREAYPSGRPSASCRRSGRPAGRP